MEKILAQRIVTSAQRSAIDEVDIDFGNGKKATYERFRFAHGSTLSTGVGVMVAAVDEGQNIYLLEEYQAGAEQRLLVLPRGGVPASETVEERANVELQEEIGMGARTITKLGTMYPMPGYIVVEISFCLAQDLYSSKLSSGDEHAELKTIKLSFPEAVEYIMSGKITDGRTIAGIFMAREYLQNH